MKGRTIRRGRIRSLKRTFGQNPKRTPQLCQDWSFIILLVFVFVFPLAKLFPVLVMVRRELGYCREPKECLFRKWECDPMPRPCMICTIRRDVKGTALPRRQNFILQIIYDIPFRPREICGFQKKWSQLLPKGIAGTCRALPAQPAFPDGIVRIIFDGATNAIDCFHFFKSRQ